MAPEGRLVTSRSGRVQKITVEGKPQYLIDAHILEFQFDDEHYRIVVLIKKGGNVKHSAS